MSVVPRFVTENWRLKLAAFGLAVFLWVVVRAEPDRGSTRTITGVPIVVEVADLDWTTASLPQPATVDVRVGGFTVFASAIDNLTVQVPVDRVSSRDSMIDLRRDWVRTGGRPSIQVQDITPSRVRVTFERTQEAAVPLSLPLEGRLPDELALARPLSVNPAVVRIRGRASRVEQVDSIALEPLDLSSLTESSTYRLALDTAGFGDLTFRPTEAAVDVRLEEAVEQVFAGVPVTLDSVPEGVDSITVVTRPTTIQVTIRGGRTRVAQVRPGSLEAVVPARVVEGLRPGEQRVVPLRIRGVPDLVRAFSTVDSVSVVRLPVETSPSDTVVPDTGAAVPDTGGAPPDTGAARPDTASGRGGRLP